MHTLFLHNQQLIIAFLSHIMHIFSFFLLFFSSSLALLENENRWVPFFDKLASDLTESPTYAVVASPASGLKAPFLLTFYIAAAAWSC